ncbi:MAG: polyprenyl synthetase family protein [Alphaproteobacteria bacterium]|nr:polyprenyl synthetase family protein [Alphaproteobacteria bacterium]
MSLTGAASAPGDLLTFADDLRVVAEDVNACLTSLLPLPQGPEQRVVEAMRYSALDGGKRLRPFLAVASADLFHVPRAHSLRAGAAVEMVHCYSLIHDDLPAMDDDDLRRGRPTCHKAFDEATAILAGDGLLTGAFAVLSDEETHPDGDTRAKLVAALAEAAGAEGMVGGQMLDLLAEDMDMSESEIERLQVLKTGRLLAVSCQVGGILGQADTATLEDLRTYGLCLGAAFQIADDLLDLEATAGDLGKATGKDDAAGKATFVSLHGPERARKRAKTLVDQAVAALSPFGESAELLRAAAAFTVNRQS